MDLELMNQICNSFSSLPFQCGHKSHLAQETKYNSQFPIMHLRILIYNTRDAKITLTGRVWNININSTTNKTIKE